MHESALLKLCMRGFEIDTETFSVKTEDPDIFTENVSVFGVEASRFRRKSCQNHYFETDAVYAEVGYYVIIRAHSQDDTTLLLRKEKVPE